MEDFIYIIVLIAWVAFAFYRKSQKKNETARRTQQSREPRNESSPFPSLEEILLGTKPGPEPEPLTDTETDTTELIPQEMRKITLEEEYKRRGMTSVGQRAQSPDKKKPEVTEMQEDEYDLEGDELEDWRTNLDLRKAVIYSEILNSPYV